MNLFESDILGALLNGLDLPAYETTSLVLMRLVYLCEASCIACIPTIGRPWGHDPTPLSNVKHFCKVVHQEFIAVDISEELHRFFLEL